MSLRCPLVSLFETFYTRLSFMPSLPKEPSSIYSGFRVAKITFEGTMLLPLEWSVYL